jgi:chloramphenicol 3-O-phosphotransferase
MVGSRKVLKIRGANQRVGNRRRRHEDRGTTNEHGVLVELSDQTMVIEGVGVLVEQPVELGSRRQNQRSEQQAGHQGGDENSAHPGLTVRFQAGCQAYVSKQDVSGSASHFFGGMGLRRPSWRDL